MGIFDIFKKKDEMIEIKNHLKLIENEFDFKIFQYKMENLENSEISVESEVAGIVRAADKSINQEHKMFDYVCISEYDSGLKEVYYSKIIDDEREAVQLVNRFSSLLQEYDSLSEKLNLEELEQMRNGNSIKLRDWTTYFDNGITYETSIVYNSTENVFSLIFLPRETYHWEREMYKALSFDFD
tara:strand:+ start:70 stop:621 length:552 start_codon:yes stop_codon:yes gene_type:complete